MQVNLQVSEAGPSKGPRHQASLSQSSTKDLPPTPISPTIHGRPTHVQAIHDFNPLLLASAAGSTSSANMYLPFKAGEIIRVHVRDTTGWWDGEISVVDAEEEARKGPRRGWFPSNYVREMGVDGSSHRRGESNTKSEATTSPKSRNQSISSTHHRHQSSTSHHSRISSTTTTQTLSPRSQAMSELPQSFQAIILPIIHALTSLDNAIHTNKRFHIQPATAAIISSIRSALMMTDCLNKESTVLSAWPTLVKERKIVLIDLSKLVGLARVATGNVNDQANPPSELDVKDLNAIATAARAVFASIQKFLNLAHGCGVRPISSADARQSSDDMGIAATSDGSRRSEVQTHTASRGLAKGRQSSNARMQETFKLRAASIGDLRAARKLASSPPPPVPMTAGMLSSNHTVTGSSSPASVGTPMSASFASSSGSARSSPVVHRPNHARQKTSSVGSSSTHSNGEPSPISQGSFTGRSYNSPAKTAPTSSSDVWEAISVAEDGLLSIIAAFIGHIHSHHISSHPSSHANLIEMTRETIDCVRELLTVVESIGRSPGIRSEKPREIDQLRVSKDNLYEIASKLVEGAESVANAPFSEVGETDYEGVKGRLLQTATATLRCGTECVRLVKLCIPEESTPSATATPRQWDPVGRQLTPRPAHEAALVYRDRLVGQRGVHTLSGLHRKASSLGQLQQRFKEGSTGIQGSMDEDEVQTEDDDEEVVGDTSREEEHTLQPAVQVTKPFPEVKRRPSLLHTHTSPSLLTPGPTSAEMFKSYSEDPGPRSRSSSLTSPAPPSRMTHRSPSRSADLDKFTADYNLPSITRRSPLAQALASPAGTPSEYHPSTAPGSLRSSGGSEHTTPAPTTPHSFDAPLDDSPVLDYLKPEPPVPAPVNRLAKLRIDTGVVGNNQLTAPRPDAPQRSATAPLPVASTDARFWVVAHDYDPREIAFNSEGNMVGASLAVLVEKMTPHDGPVEHTFWTSFFYTFRLHTKPADLVSAMIARYDIQPPTSMAVGDRERAIWIERKVVPVRLRIYNFLKAWLDTYWVAATDDVVLMTLREFASDVVSRTLPAMAPRLLDSIRRKLSGPLTGSTMSDTKSLKRASSTDKLRSAISPPSHGGLPPTPIISKSLNSLLQKNPSSSVFTITDFDTVELARQLTILESKLFCAVTPEDLLQTGKKAIPELKALSTMSNQITGWVADNILNEQDAKKRAALLKFYIKLSDKCLILNNFSTMFAILAGLNSSIVLRLKRTWDALPVKYRLIMDRLQGLIEHTKNHAAYRAKLREVDGPCLPFLGLILTDITFTSDGNADTRPSVLAPEMQLINHDKYVKLGKIAMDFARYQQPFNLHELEAVQTFLRRVLAERGSGSLDALYRKSLLLEPRQGSERVGPALDKPSWLGGRI